jgi:chromosome segregation ATPase
MSDEFGDIEQRLAAAARAVHEREVTSQRHAELRARQGELEGVLAGLRDKASAERKDVERLEGMSLGRVLASLAGSREERLSRESAEADAARYRVAEAESRLDAVRGELAAVEDRLAALESAPRVYTAVLGEKERYLTGSGDRRGEALLALADERGRLTAELNETDEAIRAADAATAALSEVQDVLRSASGWSTYDTWFGGGLIASSIKHDRMDEAAQAAALADQRLAVLRLELADIAGPGLSTAAQLALGGGTRFADVWLDNFFTDLAVADRIRQAQQQVADLAQTVQRLRGRLTARAGQVQARLTVIESERRGLLTG